MIKKLVNRKEKGFTLIELLIVVAIIGILAAIAVPAYMGYVKRAKLTEPLHALDPLKAALSAKYAKDQSFTAAANADVIRTTYGVGLDETKWSYAVAATGAITATAKAAAGSGLANGTITLTPTGNTTTGTVTWAISADGTIISNTDVQ